LHRTQTLDSHENKTIPCTSNGYNKNISLVKIFYGQNLDNLIDIKLPIEISSFSEKEGKNSNDERKILATITEHIKIIQDDYQSALTLMNNFVVINKNLYENKLNYINGTAIILMDSDFQIYYYNLDNLELILPDMKLNQFCWKAIHNSYLLNMLGNKKKNNNSNIHMSVSFNDTAFPFFSQRITSIYGPVNVKESKFFSLCDYKICKGQNFGGFIKKLLALNEEKNLTYMNERINLLKDLKIKNFSNSNAHFVNSPLLGNNNTKCMNEFHGLMVSLSATQIQFWLITPTQYFNIYNISLQVNEVNAMIEESISSSDTEERKQNLRKFLFVEPDSINWNIGVIQKGLENIKVDDLVNFDLDINNELLAASDLSNNILVFK